MDPQGHYHDRKVLPEVSGGQEELQEQVGSSICTGGTELESGCGQGQECHEGRGPQDDSQGTDLELQKSTMKNKMKRQTTFLFAARGGAWFMKRRCSISFPSDEQKSCYTIETDYEKNFVVRD